MRVYRIISAREITNLYKGLSERKAVVQGENTHRYEMGTSYIHFFRYYESAEYYFKRYRASMNDLNYEYKNLNGEYEKYLELIKKLAKQYDYDFHKIAYYLEGHNLEQLLDVKDDDRTETEIFDNKIKKLSKIFPLYD